MTLNGGCQNQVKSENEYRSSMISTSFQWRQELSKRVSPCDMNTFIEQNGNKKKNHHLCNCSILHQIFMLKLWEMYSRQSMNWYFNLEINCWVTYQLIKELFPAEWFPSSKIVIFFLGASKFNPKPLAIVIRPKKQ